MPKPVSVSITANASGVVKATSQVSSGAKKMAADVTSAAGKIDSGMDKAAAAAKRLATAERLAADAAGRVRTAESQLASVRAKSNATDTQKIKAEERLYAANRRLAASQAEVADAGKALTARGSFVDSITSHSSDIDRVSTSMLKFGAVGAAGLGLVAKAAIDWDSAWAGVTKTVNGTPQQLAAVESGLRGLSRTLPESAEQIAQVAENAGQLGIKTPDILAFTKTMVELGDTTNLSSDEAATSFGQLLNVMGDAPATVGQLGDVLVKLGNNGASTERDILQLGTRLAGAGKQIGLTTPQVLAFGSAISSTGIEAEAGGTAMSQNFFAIDKAVRKGGASLDLYAKTAGMSSDQFRKAWGDDPASATNQFVEGLGKVQASGGSVRGVLDDLGITSVRQADVYARLAGATKAAGAQTDLLADSLKDAGNAQGALTNEAAIRYATSASKIKIATNKIKDDAISIGGALLPSISAATSGVSKLADQFSDLSPSAQQGIAGTAAVGTALLLVGGGSLKAVTSIASTVTALSNLGPAGARAATGLGTAAKAAGALAVAVGVAEAAGAGFDAIFRKNDATLADAGQALVQLGKGGADATVGLDQMFSSMGKYYNDIDPFTTDITGLGGAIDRVFNRTDKEKADDFISGWLPGKDQLEVTTQQFGKLDTKLQELGATGQQGAAAKGFAELTAQFKAHNVSAEQMLTLFPKYKAQLQNVASQLDVSGLSAQDYADWMGGKIPAAVSKASAANPQLAATLHTSTDAITAQTKSLAELAAQASATSDALVAASNSEIAVQQALGAARQSAKTNGSTLNIKTAKGQANQSALNNVISTQHQNVQTEAALPHPDYAAIVKGNEAVKKSYIDTARQMGMSSKDAKASADKNFKLPKEITSQIVIKTDKLSEGEVTRLNAELKSIPKEQRARIVTIAETKGAKAAENAIAQVKDKQVIAKALGESGGAKSVKKAMDALHDRLVLAKARGDASGARAVQAAIDALHNKTVYATVVKKTITTREERKSVLNADGGFIRLAGGGPLDGGEIVGNGGPREDNIAGIDFATGEQTAWVSNREFVTNARSTEKNRDVVETVNANPDKRYSLVELAGGGYPGLKSGGKVNYNSDPRLLAAIVAQQNVDEAENLKERTKADKALEAATKHLSDSAKSLTDTATQLSKSLAEPYQSKTSDAQDFLVLMQQGATDLKGFAGQIKQLKDMGLSQTLIDQVTAMGADTGSSLAQSILAGGQGLVDALDTANTNLTKAATAVGVDSVGVKVKGYAGGTPYAPPGMAWVGEQGPELLRFRGGEAVHTAMASRRIVERNYAQTPVGWSAPTVVQSGSSDTHDYSTHVTMHGASASADQLAARIATRRRDALARRGLVGRKV